MKVFLLLAVIQLALCGSDSVTFLEPATLPEAFLEANTNERLAAACIDKQLAQCQSSFNWYLNITDNADWSDPAKLIHVLDTFYDKGVDGVLQLCYARTMFQQCLGDSYTACLQPTKFLSNGISLADAWTYIGTMRELEFTCNGGFLQTISQWNCLRAMNKLGEDTYAQCKQTFQNITTQDPSLTCPASVDFTNCARAPYYLKCGADASWWECERVRISLNLDQSCPVNVCEFHHFFASLTDPSSSDKKPMTHSERLAHTQHISSEKLNFLAKRARQIEKRMGKEN
ncbi:unnamed protein product, partial [Mesorhabditis belari]|uniref:Secreted protein n=1 Tax=Mesorhabditis belari TaxID=2138241 RepID=A0AAF3FMV4_9BILA